MPRRLFALCCLICLLSCGPAGEAETPARTPAADAAWLDYVRHAPEFRPVRQDPKLAGRWDTWLYMP